MKQTYEISSLSSLLDLGNTISVKDFVIYSLSGTVNSPLTTGEE